MASTTAGAILTGRSRATEKVVDFSPERLRAPFFLRCAALFIDYMVLLAVPLGWLISARLLDDGGPVIKLGSTVWLMVVILWLIDFLLLPLLRGQTLGKMLMGITILNLDGTSAGLLHLLLRNTVGYFLTGLTLGIGFLISAVNSSGRALHDFVGGTVVVRGRKRLI